MESFKQLMDQLETGMVDAQHRDRLKPAQKNGIIAKLTGMLDQLVDYVTVVANGNETILLASGFAVSTPSIANGFGPVKNFTVKIGAASGEVVVSVQRTYGTTTYALYYGIDNGATTVWQHVFKSNSRFVLSGLQPGKTYLFEMKIVGTNQRETKSETITKVKA